MQQQCAAVEDIAGVSISALKKRICVLVILVLKALLEARFESFEQKYQANKRRLEAVVATLDRDAAQRLEILHTLRVTWLSSTVFESLRFGR